MFRFHHHHPHHHPRYEARRHEHPGGGFGSRGPKMFDAGALRYVVLQLIAEAPRHGYEIIKEIEQRAGGGYSPSPGVIYPLLAMLEDLGHVQVTQVGAKKTHTITPEGLAFLDEHREFVSAIQARMSGGEGRGGLRQAMHELKAATIARAHEDKADDARIARIREILLDAAEEIRRLE